MICVSFLFPFPFSSLQCRGRRLRSCKPSRSECLTLLNYPSGRAFMEINNAKPGDFCWFELATSDQAAAKKFYGGLFGWTANDNPMGPDAFYTMFQLSGRNVGAAYALMPDQLKQGVPPHWGTYVAVAS